MNVISVVIPTFVIFLIGYIGQRQLNLDTKTASTLALYLMSPFLAFRTFYTNSVDERFVYLVLYAVLLCSLLILSVYGYCLIRKKQQDFNALVLSSAFMNNGNYGTPIVLFAFGTKGFEIAIMLMVIQQLIMSTAGIFFAAQGSAGSTGLSGARRAVYRMPIAYGAIIGFSFQMAGIQMPDPVYQGIDYVANAAIPTIMVILGMQLASIPWRFEESEKLFFSLTSRLIWSPIIAFCLTVLLPVDELTAAIMITMAATPTAANTTMFAIQYGTQPQFVSRATLFSTLFSIITVPAVLWLVLH